MPPILGAKSMMRAARGVVGVILAGGFAWAGMVPDPALVVDPAFEVVRVVPRPPAVHPETRAVADVLADGTPVSADDPHVVRIARTIRGTARWWDVDPLLVARLVRSESWVDSTAVSSVGALGLGQVRPEIWLGAFPSCGQNLLRVRDNVCHTVRILRYYIERAGGDMHEALAGYSGGCRIGGPCEWYVRRILTDD